jgi:hypothetical protein
VGEFSLWVDYQCAHVFGRILIPLLQNEPLLEEALDRLEGEGTKADRERNCKPGMMVLKDPKVE